MSRQINSLQPRRLNELPDKHFFIRALTDRISKAGQERLALQVVECPAHPAGRPGELEDALAQRIYASVRSDDLVARIDTNTIGILFNHVQTTAEAISIAQRMLSLTSPIANPGTGEASVGILMLDGQAVPAMLAIAQAHTAALRAQQYSCGRWELWRSDSESAHAVAREADRWAQRIHAGLKQEEFRLYYQPQLALDTGKVVGVEALVRWQQSDRLVPPAEFIPAAENNGSIVQLGEWVLDEACRQMAFWQREDMHCPRMAVNVSAHQLRGGIVDTVWRTLARHSLAPSQLEIELTESALLSDPAEAKAIAHELADLGVTLSLDDFGVGYSSFARLRSMPFKTVKIDHQFVSRMTADSYDYDLIRMLIDLAKKKQITTIAEGVEQPEQRELLSSLGCDAWQGYLCAPPLPAERITQFLRQPGVLQ
ncbi:GGDEF domain-containing protein [Pigmentiphaga aceris]|uniref:GGDEF domain-containing protein n=1 Tax=Pigmentiphaga aceris TaxID=1940612 RepID=A0A5C0AXU8_9BURK|nr:GGDEF domain-containing phosphodiesterase [Pigmentiphaga aceris]QEI07289.1 GGDEF domain-containing protein [Pigmentiphaga aceris]